jgi:hypothetical protein
MDPRSHISGFVLSLGYNDRKESRRGETFCTGEW